MPKAKAATKDKSQSKKIDLGSTFSLTKIDKKSLTVSHETVERFGSAASRLNKGRATGSLEVSDILSTALFQIGPKGLSFKTKRASSADLHLSMPSDAWEILKALAEKNGSTEEQVLEEISKLL